MQPSQQYKLNRIISIFNSNSSFLVCMHICVHVTSGHHYTYIIIIAVMCCVHKNICNCVFPSLYVMTFYCYVSHVASIAKPPANDTDNDDDTCNSTVFTILFVLSLVVNILLAVVIIYLTVRLKKITARSPPV